MSKVELRNLLLVLFASIIAVVAVIAIYVGLISGLTITNHWLQKAPDTAIQEITIEADRDWTITLYSPSDTEYDVHHHYGQKPIINYTLSCSYITLENETIRAPIGWYLYIQETDDSSHMVTQK